METPGLASTVMLVADLQIRTPIGIPRTPLDSELCGISAEILRNSRSIIGIPGAYALVLLPHVLLLRLVLTS